MRDSSWRGVADMVLWPPPPGPPRLPNISYQYTYIHTFIGTYILRTKIKYEESKYGILSSLFIPAALMVK